MWGQCVTLASINVQPTISVMELECVQGAEPSISAIRPAISQSGGWEGFSPHLNTTN